MEGIITDQPGPFKVRLTKSASVYAEQDIISFEPVAGAAVHILDDKGNDFHLYQGVNGFYETIDTCLQGIPGNTYKLHITDEDGVQYESTPELMLEVPPSWTTEYSRSILVNSTVSSRTDSILSYPITSIGPEDDRLGNRYSILVKQYDLNKELYDYFKKLESLNETNGGIFDKLPSPLYGNIHSVSGNKPVLGYFFVSAVKTKRIFISNGETHMKTGHSEYSKCGWVSPPLCYSPYYHYGKISEGDSYVVGLEVWGTDKFVPTAE